MDTSSIVSWDGDPDVRGPPPVENSILPEHFCIGSAFAFDTNYIYNSRDGKSYHSHVGCTFLTSLGTMLYIDVESKWIVEYANETFRPTEFVMKTWIENLHDLFYLWTPWWTPWWTPQRMMTEPGPGQCDPKTMERKFPCKSCLLA
jgi:hypothetical protein